MITITQEQILRLAPNARSSYRQTFEQADDALARYDINSRALRVAHFLAQILHETGGLTILEENLNYRPERLMQVWPSRFPTLTSARPFAHNPQALANKVYGSRMGNRVANDGWNFRGRGMLQLTGRDSYERIGRLLGVNFINNPELVLDHQCSLLVAAAEWSLKDCNRYADADSITKITREINGGLIGLASRRDWLAKTKHEWTVKE